MSGGMPLLESRVRCGSGATGCLPADACFPQAGKPLVAPRGFAFEPGFNRCPPKRHRGTTGRTDRRGVVTFWTILCVPLLLLILAVVVEVNRLWQARVQLENALEAAALATVKEWGDHGGTAANIPVALAVGKDFARANAIHQVPVDLDDRAIVPHAVCAFGTASPNGSRFTFRPAPDAKAQFAVVLEAQANVRSLFRPLLERVLSHPTVTASTAAFYDPSVPSARPKLIRID